MRTVPVAAATALLAWLVVLLLVLPPSGDAVRRVLIRAPNQSRHYALGLKGSGEVTDTVLDEKQRKIAVREGHIIRAPNRIVNPGEVCTGGRRPGGGRCRDQW